MVLVVTHQFSKTDKRVPRELVTSFCFLENGCLCETCIPYKSKTVISRKLKSTGPGEPHSKTETVFIENKNCFFCKISYACFKNHYTFTI